MRDVLMFRPVETPLQKGFALPWERYFYSGWMEDSIVERERELIVLRVGKLYSIVSSLSTTRNISWLQLCTYNSLQLFSRQVPIIFRITKVRMKNNNNTCHWQKKFPLCPHSILKYRRYFTFEWLLSHLGEHSLPHASVLLFGCNWITILISSLIPSLSPPLPNWITPIISISSTEFITSDIWLNGILRNDRARGHLFISTIPSSIYSWPELRW